MLILLLPLLAWADVDPDIDQRIHVAELIERAENSPINVNGQMYPRVERDPEGQVKRLRLDGFALSEVELRAMSRIPTLRSLSLNGTNVKDADLIGLRRLPQLTSLTLNATKITDASVEHIKALPALRSLCLLNVSLSQEAVDDLKATCRQMGIGFRRARPLP